MRGLRFGGPVDSCRPVSDSGIAGSKGCGAAVCRVVERDLAASPQDPRLVRRWAAGVLQDWELGSELDRALLVLNELVTNALVHSPGGGLCRLTVDGGALEVLVTDHGSGPPRRALRAATDVPEAPSWERPGGRGLQIVAAMSDSWGLVLPDGGAGVWARWQVAPGWPYAAGCVCRDEADEDGVPLASGGTAVAMPGPWEDAGRAAQH